ncbi:MAG: trigger factor [Burkholderiales bacterium]|nr:trigger factor [Bacteroidia bacterium]
MNISKKDISPLNAQLSITLAPTDYEVKVENAIKKVQKQAAMPGFRAGKVPVGLIKKQHGKSILVDEINKILNETLYNYIRDNKIEILGNPMPTEETKIDFDNQKEFTFNYELGLTPQFDVKLDNTQSFVYNTVKIDDELVEKYLKDVKRNYGKPSNPEVAEEKDVLYIDIVELDADNNIVAGGVFKSTSIGIDRLKSETAKAKLIGAKKEDKIIINANELYDSAVDKSISLGIDKEVAESFSANLQLTVRNIARMEDAELNQELFDKLYGAGTVNSVEEFKEKIKGELALMFAQDTDRKFVEGVEKTLVEKLNITLPDDFLKRWLMTVNEKPLTKEQLEAEYPSYAKNMQWKLIENKIIKNNNIAVTPDEAKEEASHYVRSQFSRYGQVPEESEVAKIVDGILSKEPEAQKIFEGLYSKKVLNVLKTSCKLDTKEVSYNEFFGIKD